MVLEDIINIAPEIGLCAGAEMIDVLSTYNHVRKYGISTESNDNIREDMRKKGVFKALMNKFIKATSSISLYLVGMYLIDKYISPPDSNIKLHEVTAYFASSIVAATGLGNLALTYGYDRIASILKIPARIIEKFSPNHSSSIEEANKKDFDKGLM